MNTFANPQLALAFLISCWAKATLLLAGAWLMVVALRQRSSAAQRHHVWAAAILASLALPFFSLLLPTWHSATLGSAATLWIPRTRTQRALALRQFLPSSLLPHRTPLSSTNLPSLLFAGGHSGSRSSC